MKRNSTTALLALGLKSRTVWFAWMIVNVVFATGTLGQSIPFVDLNKPVALRLTPGENMQVKVRASSKPVSNAFVYFLRPPVTDYQTEVQAQFTETVEGHRVLPQVVHELSPHQRPMFRVPANQQTTFELEANITYRPWRSVLVNTDATNKPVFKRLAAAQRLLYTKPTGSYPSSDPEFRNWLKGHNLLRQPKETPIVFAHRALIFVAKNFNYSTNNVPWNVAQIAKLGIGECNAITGVYSTILRANDIPARRICGRFSEGETHNKVEVFFDDVGWVRVEPTGAIGSKREDLMDCFGFDNGQFFVCMEDSDLVFPAAGTGVSVGVIARFWVIQAPKVAYRLSDTWQRKTIHHMPISGIN